MFAPFLEHYVSPKKCLNPKNLHNTPLQSSKSVQTHTFKMKQQLKACDGTFLD